MQLLAVQLLFSQGYCQQKWSGPAAPAMSGLATEAVLGLPLFAGYGQQQPG